MLKKSISMGVLVLATAALSVAANKTTFEDLQSTTSAVKTQADAVKTTYRGTGYDWNAEQLQAIRDETNRIGKDLRKLQESPLTATEQRAVNHALPILQNMAADTTRAIQALNEKGRPVDNNGPLFNDNLHHHVAAIEANAAQAEKIFQSLRPYEGTNGPLETRQQPKGTSDAGQEVGR
jgi:hypothetical protein